MIAIDTNVLVYAYRTDMAENASARAAIGSLVDTRWGIAWPCVHEFLATVTRVGRWSIPTPLAEAVAAVTTLADEPTVTFLGEAPAHLEILGGLLTRSGVTGPRVHDARIAAICLGHGIDELWTADRDFSYFPELRTRNPLVARA